VFTTSAHSPDGTDHAVEVAAAIRDNVQRRPRRQLVQQLPTPPSREMRVQGFSPSVTHAKPSEAERLG
jgi:hypothetical protein